MGAETTLLLMLVLTLCIALLGPGLISIEDTRRTKSPREDKTNDATCSE